MLALHQQKSIQPASAPLFASEQSMLCQHTLTDRLSFTGVGVHSGNPVTLVLRPAPVNTGYVFIRTDVKKGTGEISATWESVVDTRMNTTLANAYGVQISTVEHVLAALAGCGVDNVYIEVNGPEVPIMDGSSRVFVQQISQSGVRPQQGNIRRIRVLKPIQVTEGQATVFLLPAEESRIYIRFNAHGRMGDQNFIFYPEEDSFMDLISSARTFGFYEDAQKIRALGLAQGASLENTIVFDEGRVLNPEGLRYQDECVRHKVLDAIGDLALAGGRLIGHYDGTNPGHSLNNKLLRTLFADTTAWRIETE
jgi:UDP-3-O-[3-hydroxymyristoyl] N-acetylglucosamine deacetylase